MKWACIPGVPVNSTPDNSVPPEIEEPLDAGVDLASFSIPKLDPKLKQNSKNILSVPSNYIPPVKRTNNRDLQGYLPSCDQYAALCTQFELVKRTLPEYLSKSMR